MTPEQPPVGGSGIDQNPPEQPSSFKVKIRTQHIGQCSELPVNVQTAIQGFEEREMASLWKTTSQ